MRRAVLSPRAVPALAVILASMLSAAESRGEEPHGDRNEFRPHAAMLQFPDVGKESIVFLYANDLWVVDRNGGVALPLASPPGREMFPKFSPDEETIAFMGNYDGNRDLYTIPVDGGLPTRATHHPSVEMLCDFTPEGELLFYASGIEGMPRRTQLFTVDAEGGFPKKLPMPYGAAGAVSPDGQWIAYTPHTRDARSWKRYRGGMATDIWLFNPETCESRRVTDWEGTDTLPMWHGKKLYYLSDAGDESRLNIWVYDPRTDERRQITAFAEFDVKWPSIGPGDVGQGEIVFQNGPGLFLLDLREETAREVSVTIPGDRPSLRPRTVDTSEFIRWWQISPTGKRAVVEARGDIWTLPAEKGSPRNLTRTSGVAEREPSWSPDGRWIAYFSDASGEYELFVTQSDGKGETRQLTEDSATYYYDPIWSPDSKHLLYRDKAYRLLLHDLDSKETKVLATDPWGAEDRPSWSHDSRWIAYQRSREDSPVSAIWLYDLKNDEHHQVTSGFFPDASPTFDRKGDYLYFVSNRAFSPSYSDIDESFIYDDGQVLIAVPLRTDIKSPWLPESDEEEWKSEKKEQEDEKAENGEDEESVEDDAKAEDDAGEEDEGDGGEQDAEAAPDDGVSGVWEGTLRGGEFPPGLTFSMTLSLSSDGTITGTIAIPMGTGEITGTYDAATGDISGEIVTEGGDVASFTGRITGSSFTCSVTFGGQIVELKGERTSAAADTDENDAKKGGKEEKAAKVVEIDLEGFERRGMQLPVSAGRFGPLAVNDKGALLYVRLKKKDPPALMLFDMKDEKKEEKTVAPGTGAFELSADGKKVLTIRGGSASIQNAQAGATGKSVVTEGMTAVIDPREEWKQIFNEAWRLQRDFFYLENMHGVDWPAVRARYERMLDDCATRDDLSYVIREMIAELNIGHAYYFGGDVEDEPSTTVGMLGVDFERDEHGYRIAAIQEGAIWDVDARGPLSEPGVDVHVGDYVLAVNGVPLDLELDPWAAFAGTAGRPITITVSEEPELADKARDVVVKPIPSERELRYRSWIERNRAYVQEKSDGRVGYIYVPNTGVDGQNDLVRQYFAQLDKKALIIDERWNGGGQIPTRFIEMLNRPVTNYWARRDAKDATWPPDAHHGPKCMLINGLAGSGGDMFPWLFRQAGLGKLIGTRTWGGLVGISGNPALIDDGQVTVPTFGFYEKNGTWGIEGHGVDPDIVVVDDPALMCEGGDPQLDAAIDLMLEEIERNPYVKPKRPASPDRSGMGIKEEDK